MPYSSPSCFVTLCSPVEAVKLEQRLAAKGYMIDQPAFTRFRARKEGLSCMVYLSGKVLVQGSDVPCFVEAFFPSAALDKAPANVPTVQKKSSKKYISCMGFDESGKGDVFGPLCFAGVYVGENESAQLVEWGVCDSKKLADKQILMLATKIRQHYTYETLVLMPEQYNALYTKFRNLNRLMAWGHVELMTLLHQKTRCTHAVLDQFCSPLEVEKVLKPKRIDVNLIQKTGAESSEIAVAAASILARACFVEGMETLSTQFGLTIPKGAVHGVVQTGRRILEQYGESGLEKTIKLHFKTLTAIRN